MGEDTNSERAGRGEVALRAHAEACHAPYDGADRDGVVDLLCDLGHFCAAVGIDFEAALVMAGVHLDAETTDKGDLP